MKFVITDVSVLFDLYKLKILHFFFNQDWDIYTTDFVYDEIVNIEQIIEFQEYVEKSLLKIITISAEETEQIEAMILSRRNRSFPDRSILWKATQLGAVLLTCDKALRREADVRKLEVHGTLWIIEQLVQDNIITKNQAIQLLNQLLQFNVRAPINEIKRLKNKWK
jgi:predicted nucleic acid-binding protein